MARKNNRWDNHQSVGVIATKENHTCTPVATRTGHVCLTCGRPVSVLTQRGK